MGTAYFLFIFLLGELALNLSVFPHLKNRFIDEQPTSQAERRFCFLEMSVFKGILERFVLYFGLINQLPAVLIVFGALKIGTRLEQNVKIQNDYFLIGNFTSILATLIYWQCFKLLMRIQPLSVWF